MLLHESKQLGVMQIYASDSLEDQWQSLAMVPLLSYSLSLSRFFTFITIISPTLEYWRLEIYNILE
jgi:hypothetical protein